MVVNSDEAEVSTDTSPDAAGHELDPETAALLDRVNPLGDTADYRSGGRNAFDATEPAGDDDESQDVQNDDQPDQIYVGLVGAAQGPQEGARVQATEAKHIASDTDFASDFQAIVRKDVLDGVRIHGEEQPTTEVCGVLVGRVYENPTAGLVYVDDIIRGNHATGRNSAVTFTADTWAYIEREMDEKHPGKRIVGWYHTHPGFGVFLSEMDLFIQKHFFNAAWQTALVYDPQSGERGMFAWRKGETRKVDFVVDDGNGPALGQRELAGNPLLPGDGPHDDPVPAMPGSNADLVIKIETLERRQRWIFVAVTVVALLSVVWPLVALTVVPGALHGAPPPAPPVVPALPDLPDLSQSSDAADGTNHTNGSASALTGPRRSVPAKAGHLKGEPGTTNPDGLTGAQRSSLDPSMPARPATTQAH